MRVNCEDCYSNNTSTATTWKTILCKMESLEHKGKARQRKQLCSYLLTIAKGEVKCNIMY